MAGIAPNFYGFESTKIILEANAKLLGTIPVNNF